MKCPDCLVEMAERSFMGVTIDQCDSCEGVWFDRGELGPYLRRIRSDTNVEIPPEPQFRLGKTANASACPKCAACDLRSGSFRGVSFATCSSCDGLYLSDESIKAILDKVRNDRLNAPRKEMRYSPVEALSYLLIAGELGLFIYLLAGARPTERKRNVT